MGITVKKTKYGIPAKLTTLRKLGLLIRLRSWVPERYHLCYGCVTYKFPDDEDGWQTRGPMVVRSGVATCQARKDGPICPLCIMRRQLKAENSGILSQRRRAMMAQLSLDLRGIQKL